jgi:glucose-6-phosphate 1-epimerase
MPKVVLAAPDRARAEIYLHGAHVTSWVPAGGQERLFLSRTTQFDGKAPLRGGIPVIFPQFSSFGPLPNHGFARRIPWSFAGREIGATSAVARFTLQDDEITRQLWPHAFHAGLAVTVGGPELTVALTIANPDVESFSFTCALHTYLRVANIHATFLAGLDGIPYLDSTAGNVERLQPQGDMSIAREVDRIYPNAPDRLVVREPGRSLTLEKTGLPDAVVWNPWAEHTAALSDLEPEGYLRFLCIEPSAILKPVTLAPGESWTGVQKLVA